MTNKERQQWILTTPYAEVKAWLVKGRPSCQAFINMTTARIYYRATVRGVIIDADQKFETGQQAQDYAATALRQMRAEVKEAKVKAQAEGVNHV